jgi:hypothetical protein
LDDYDEIKKLRSTQGLHINWQYKGGRTFLMMAWGIIYFNPETLEMILKILGIDFSFKDRDVKTANFYAMSCF